ncbi:MAG: hypothetical protein PHP13_06685 [Methanomicrobium sp.]|nr:hypothetical protein [Methanomicrobium sp.]
MKQIPNLRDFLYPAEWAIRFAAITLLISVLMDLNPGQPVLILIVLAAVAGIILGVLLQLTYIMRWLKDDEK